MSKKPLEIMPSDVARLIQDDPKLVLLDCRTGEERRIANIDQSTHIPMNEIPDRIDELSPYMDTPVIVYCHGGKRSLAVTALLRTKGFEKAQSLCGGIDRWSQEVDSSIPQY
jgi:rhodanese-related sulfurtransferase